MGILKGKPHETPGIMTGFLKFQKGAWGGKGKSCFLSNIWYNDSIMSMYAPGASPVENKRVYGIFGGAGEWGAQAYPSGG